jgi:hypothetical protein
VVKIHQIYYLDSQRPFLDPAFIPYDNRENARPQWAEYHVFQKEYAARPCPDGEYLGYFSWKFGAKTRLSGRRFIKFIAESPGADVYFVNPYPLHGRLFKSVWEQGEFYHPGILRFSESIIRRAGYAFDLTSLVNDDSSLLFCNYWVGNNTFWNRYMRFASDVERVLLNELTPAEQAFLHSTADLERKTLSHIPFILERLFSTLVPNAPDLTYRAYRYSAADLRARYGAVRGTLFRLLPERPPGMQRLIRVPLLLKAQVTKPIRALRRRRLIRGRTESDSGQLAPPA